MAVAKKALFHGAALIAIVEDPTFTALNKASDAYGHYKVNETAKLWIKYAKTPSRQQAGDVYQFSFSPDDLQAIKADRVRGGRILIPLVCGDELICCLTREELFSRIPAPIKQTSVRVMRLSRPGTQPRVLIEGAAEFNVPGSRYPKIVFG